MVLYLTRLKVQCLVLLNIPNLEKILVIKKVYDLVYLSGLLKISLKVSCIAVFKALYNIIHLLYMKKIRSRKGGLFAWIKG